MSKFPFNDLHRFKDYLGFVKLCAPDLFPPREDVGPDDQWTLELAFRGLRKGLEAAIREKGDRPAFAECKALVEEAFAAYSARHVRDGYSKLDEAHKRLKTIPTQ